MDFSQCSIIPLFPCFSFCLPCRAVLSRRSRFAYKGGSPGEAGCHLSSVICLLSPSFFLTSPHFPYKFPNKPIRYPVHEQLNLSLFSN
jgi:hypothetical protein